MEEEFELNQPLNQSALEGIKSRLEQLQDTMESFFSALEGNNNSQFPDWDDVLSRYNLLVAKFVGLNKELTKDELHKHALLFPKEIFTTEQDPSTLGYFLRTKQPPEVENEENEMLEDEFKDLDEVDENQNTNFMDLTKAQARWKRRAQAQDEICQHALSTFDAMRSKFDFYKRPIKKLKKKPVNEGTEIAKGGEQEEGIARSGEATGEVETDTKIEIETETKAELANTSEGKTESSPKDKSREKSKEKKAPEPELPKSLDQILGYYSSGRRFDC